MAINAQAYIDCHAFEHNLQQVKALAPKANIMAMVKSNAYGHGVDYAVDYLSDANAFGLARLHEAQRLRQLGVKKDLILVEGFLEPEELQAVEQDDLQIVIHQLWQLEALQQQPLKKNIRVWLKIDTGMHRLGVAANQVNDILDALKNCPWVDKDIGLMTHFASADEVESPQTTAQIKNFQEITQGIEGETSLANSAGILAWPDSHGSWVRPGLMLYGASPFANQTAKDHHLLPVMTLTSRLIAINPVAKGEFIGYGATWQAPETMPIGVVAIGYGDGYPRQAKNGTPVLINNTVCSMVGRVSMDMITVDLRGYPEAKVGDKVTLWGHNLPVETIAQWADTVPYTLLTGVTSRVEFLHL